MNVYSIRCWSLFALLSLVGVIGFADAASAGQGVLLQASMMTEIVGDRARMIQVSLVVVALGCGLLWWSK